MDAGIASIFCAMKNNTKYLSHGAMIAALYVVLTYLQNMMFPDSATMAIQFRASEALCVLAFFTPAAIPGLSVGCLLFNLAFVSAMPLDVLLGTLATVLATTGMYLTRKLKLWGLPVLGLLLPAVLNGLLVSISLTIYIGGGYWLNFLCVAIGELAVLLSLGTALYFIIAKRGLQKRIF